MTMQNRIRDELIRRFTESGWDSIQITMKTSGHVLTLEPCSEINPHCSGAEDCAWVLVYGSPMPYIGGTLDDTSKHLANYDKMLSEHDDDLSKLNREAQLLRECLTRNGKPIQSKQEWMDRYDFLSDWSKDVLGHRLRIACPDHLV